LEETRGGRRVGIVTDVVLVCSNTSESGAPLCGISPVDLRLDWSSGDRDPRSSNSSSSPSSVDSTSEPKLPVNPILGSDDLALFRLLNSDSVSRGRISPNSPPPPSTMLPLALVLALALALALVLLSVLPPLLPLLLPRPVARSFRRRLLRSRTAASDSDLDLGETAANPSSSTAPPSSKPSDPPRRRSL
jgi:hypothetical protein